MTSPLSSSRPSTNHKQTKPHLSFFVLKQQASAAFIFRPSLDTWYAGLIILCPQSAALMEPSSQEAELLASSHSSS